VLAYTQLEGIADVVLGTSTAAVVREKSKLVNGGSLAGFLSEVLELQRSHYCCVLVLFSGEQQSGGFGDKKWRELVEALSTAVGVVLLLCEDQADVASHLAAVAAAEAANGRACPSPSLDGSQRVLAFLRECPCVSYPAALRLMAHFKGKRVAALLAMSKRDLDDACPWLGAQQRRNILHYFSRAFEVDALAM